MLRDVQLTRQERDKLDARDRELDLAQRSVREQLERLGQEHRRLLEAGRSADGRDLAAAADEQAEAREVLEEYIGRDHAARVLRSSTQRPTFVRPRAVRPSPRPSSRCWRPQASSAAP